MAPLENNNQHMNREFFSGHKLPVIFICFLENGPQAFITIDENGHICHWLYNAEHVTSKQRFEPAAKLRIELKYPRYTVKSKEERLFPAAGAKELDQSKTVTA